MKLNFSKKMLIGIGFAVSVLVFGGGAFALLNQPKVETDPETAFVPSLIKSESSSNASFVDLKDPKASPIDPNSKVTESVTKSTENSKVENSSKSSSKTTTSVSSTSTKLQMGKITGTVANVFNNGPKIMPIKVCAFETASKKEYCVDTSGKTDEFYEIKAPFGQYYVYSFLPEPKNQINLRFISFYDEATKCLPFDQKANASGAAKNREGCRKQFPKSKPVLLTIKDEKALQSVRPWSSVTKYTDSTLLK
jgi:hypothetical protein